MNSKLNNKRNAEQPKETPKRSKFMVDNNDNDYEFEDVTKKICDSNKFIIYEELKSCQEEYINGVSVRGCITRINYNPTAVNIKGKRTLTLELKDKENLMKISIWEKNIQHFLNTKPKIMDQIELTAVNLKKTDKTSLQYNNGTTHYTATWSKNTTIAFNGEQQPTFCNLESLGLLNEGEYVCIKGVVIDILKHPKSKIIQIGQRTRVINLVVKEEYYDEIKDINKNTKLAIIGGKKGQQTIWYNLFTQLKKITAL